MFGYIVYLFNISIKRISTDGSLAEEGGRVWVSSVSLSVVLGQSAVWGPDAQPSAKSVLVLSYHLFSKFLMR